ncbi:MAG: SDR family oxidoreductase [Alphaproteobacteria bacterium]|nr:SDR family oxidoreductase [Alphaproteobacteria bacterium]
MDKAVLITGAGKRIGRALALGLAADGWRVGVHYHRAQAEAESLCAEINSKDKSKDKQKPQAVPLQADFADSEAVQALMPRAIDALGPLAALINNASLFERDTPTSLTNMSWDRHLNINLRAPALLMRDFAKQAQQGGNIINMIDQRIWRLTPDFTSYTVSKTGLWTLTQTFAQAFAKQNIRVNAIGPGPALPGPRQSQAAFDKQTQLVPLGYGAKPQDILDAVRYILNAKPMTGQMIALDGGQHLAWQTPDVIQGNE